MKKPNPRPTKQKPKGKLTTYICTMVDSKSGKTITHEVRAEKLVDVGVICKKKFGVFPIGVEKKPYAPSPYLTQRLIDHEGLKSLAKELSKNQGGK